MPNRHSVPAFSSFRYRDLVERLFNKLKHLRAVATRYDKTPENYVACLMESITTCRSIGDAAIDFEAEISLRLREVDEVKSGPTWKDYTSPNLLFPSLHPSHP